MLRWGGGGKGEVAFITQNLIRELSTDSNCRLIVSFWTHYFDTTVSVIGGHCTLKQEFFNLWQVTKASKGNI